MKRQGLHESELVKIVPLIAAATVKLLPTIAPNRAARIALVWRHRRTQCHGTGWRVVKKVNARGSHWMPHTVPDVEMVRVKR